ncbi:hypothetical protein M3Y97_00687900 [Aphelenchoides bicaudatus]|nr:hypothetical protein M3Y97_00687900 [Aphelenchoides bicaudatus]
MNNPQNDSNSYSIGQPLIQSTPLSFGISGNECESRELIGHLEDAIKTVESHMYIIKDHAKEEMTRMKEAHKQREERLAIAMELLANDRVTMEEEKTILSTQLANTRVELKNARDQLQKSQARHSGDVQNSDEKLKSANQERTKLQSELSGLKVKFNDARRLTTDQKSKIEELETKLKKSNEANSKLMTSNAQIRIQNERLQKRVDQLEQQLRQLEVRPLSANSTDRQTRPSSSLSIPAASTGRQSRPQSTLRFSNRTQVRDITPPTFSSLVENKRSTSPVEIGSEIHTTSCRHNCHLFEHEGDEGRFRWVCGINEQLMTLYRENRFVVYVPNSAEIQFFGDGPNKGQIIVFWTGQASLKEITVLHTSGVREEYRLNPDGKIIYREVFNFDGPAFRVNGEETVEISQDEATTLVANVRVVQNTQNDVQVHHANFGFRIVNFEFLRIQVVAERVQITMCLCEGKRAFNVKHCSEDFTQKSLCTFLGQCVNLPVR